MHARRSDERGAAVVEFALVLPLLLLLVFGIYEFGRGYHAKISLTHAAREGARAAAVGDADPVAVTKAAAGAVDPKRITVTTTPCNPGQPVTVTATHQFQYDIPLFKSGQITLTGTGVMRCAG